MEFVGQDSSIEEQFQRAIRERKNDFWSGSAPTPERHRAGISLVIWIFMPQLGKAAGGRRTADETDGYVPTSRLSNGTTPRKNAQIGAKTDPKPFTTENVLLCISITMLASILAHISSPCARPTHSAHVVFLW